MTGPDPVDVRLLSAVAEVGRAAVPDIAGRLGMDVREVAARLAALSTTGLPLVVGVECDQQGIRNAVAVAQQWAAQNAASGPHPTAGYSGPHPMSGPYPASGPHPVPGPHQGPVSGPAPVPGPPPMPQPPVAPQPPMSTWGPPGSAAWARGDQPAPVPAQPPAGTSTIGTKLDVHGVSGERISIQLIEVVDPADFLFTAAGHELQEGERSVVVHTELTNHGQVPFSSLPDMYLELITKDGAPVTKAPVSMSSRPPHRMGVQPGETAGGHTIYVLPESTELSAVRWTPQPGDQQRTLLWDITGL
ncbi:AsnC family protein [Saccharopolyspora sp. TS4A08]|uniref:AsnC family protein n=1 Tax=Saccharopolyspora ipomoeae TaxID=3042027 RepID=A0ABT6PK42_9PSEU|nr:AsnC family protein [Saccharopolyspora sp. TS4A08]MDI2028334.1 AsnC family protein [Saccharopolyspora sp. TS4A08]